MEKVKKINNETEIILITKIKAPIQIVFDCTRSVDIHVISTAQTKEKAIAGRTSGLCELGDEITWKAKHFGIYQTLSTKITKYKAPFHFQDTMISGAFSYLKHNHFFEEKDGYIEMKDVVLYTLPYGLLGKLFDKIVLKKYMINLLTTRNDIIKQVCENE